MPYSIRVRTAEKSNIAQGGNEEKFYRTYELPSASVMQWGSQRNGRSGGQYKASPGPSDAAAVMSKKVGDGYSVVSDESFEMDDSIYTTLMTMSDTKQMGSRLEKEYNAAVRAGRTTTGNTTPTRRTAAPTGRAGSAGRSPVSPPAGPTTSNASHAGIARTAIDTLANEALDLITLAATDPVAAMVKRGPIRAQQDEVVMAVMKLTSYLDTLDEMIEENA